VRLNFASDIEDTTVMASLGAESMFPKEPMAKARQIITDSQII